MLRLTERRGLRGEAPRPGGPPAHATILLARAMRYEQPQPVSQDDARRIAEGGNVPELATTAIAVALHEPDADWAERYLCSLCRHPEPNVRGNAILGLGHLARIHRRLRHPEARPLIVRGLVDEDGYVRGQADAAADDVRQFLGWRIEAPRLSPGSPPDPLDGAAPPPDTGSRSAEVPTLEASRRVLMNGIKRADQGSLERGAPKRSSLPELMKAREDLYKISISDEKNPEVWRLLALVEEYLLNYPSALANLRMAISLGGGATRKEHKKLAQLEEELARRAPGRRGRT